MHPVRSRCRPAHARSQIAVAIRPYAIGKPGRHVRDHLPHTQRPPLHDLENPDAAGAPGSWEFPLPEMWSHDSSGKSTARSA